MSTISGRLVLPGIAASHGVAVGPARIASAQGAVTVRRRLPDELVEGEVERFRRAIEASRGEIEEARDVIDERQPAGADWSLILDAHLLMHRDELVVDATIDTIRRKKCDAEWALKTTTEGLRDQLLGAGSSYFRDRAQDVEHVARHILRWLGGGKSAVPHISGPSVLVADDLSPADAARLGALPVLALVLETGSTTSHTAILARALGIPAVVGVRGIVGSLAEGDVIIVDALWGEVVLAASPEECGHARERGRRHGDFTARLKAQAPRPGATADGTRVELLANLDLPVEAALLGGTGAEGVGLYRTEFLFLGRRDFPSEEEQLQVYRGVIEAVGHLPVTFRTCDLGADKMPAAAANLHSVNPSLGVRGLRFFLSRPDLMRAQVRAILRAAEGGTLRLLLPLVATVEELCTAKAIVAEERAALESEGHRVGEVPLGIMIEVPSAALLADVFARECDFFSVGTNDLVQYTLAADRGNPYVAHIAKALDPAVLRLLSTVSQAARSQGLPLSMCGDMAADPVALPVVIGLGFRSLSVPPPALPLVREVVSRVDAGVAEDLVDSLLGLGRVETVRERVIEAFAPLLGDIWAEEGVEGPHS